MKLLDSTGKTNWKFIAIVAVLGLVAGGGILWYASSPMSESPVLQAPVQRIVTPKQEAQKLIDTSGWQTYRNEEFGFEVSYPPEWKAQFFSGTSLWHIFHPQVDQKLQENAGEISVPNGIYSYIIKTGESIDEFIQKTHDRGRIVEKKEVVFYGMPGVFVKYDTLEGTFESTYVRHSNGQFIFAFRINKKFGMNFGIPNYSEETFDQILSTFRFIDKKMKQADDQNSCEKQGGKWQKAGALQGFMCIFTYTDGGKVCKSSDECEGDCIVTQDGQTTGFCKQNTDPFGCFSTIESVKKGNGILCRD